MLRSGDRIAIELPFGVTPEAVMHSLEIGHGYNWLVLTKSPTLVAHGSSDLGNMPEILLIGGNLLIVSGSDTVYAERLQRVLEMLRRQIKSMSTAGGTVVG
jgi:succinyl-CoA synthetase alpha subunit